MLISGLVHPQLSSLLCRIRHTNSLVLADVAFPFWPEVETIDLALTFGVPSLLQVLRVVRQNWKCGAIFMAQEFLDHNDRKTRKAFGKACHGVELKFEPHLEFKQRVPHAIGLVRTGDATLYANMILVSA